MKKLIFALLLVGCAKQETPETINGIWRGQEFWVYSSVFRMKFNITQMGDSVLCIPDITVINASTGNVDENNYNWTQTEGRMAGDSVYLSFRALGNSPQHFFKLFQDGEHLTGRYYLNTMTVYNDLFFIRQ